MKKHALFITVLFTIVVLLCCCAKDPPPGKRIETRPQKYLKTNHYIEKIRENLKDKKILTTDFLPQKIDETQTVSYMFWYECGLLSLPNYAITATVNNLTDTDFQTEKERILKLDGFEEIVLDDCCVLCKPELPSILSGYFDPPILDGYVYNIEYAIISEQKHAITYSEVHVWEGSIVDEQIEYQLKQLYDNINAFSGCAIQEQVSP